MIRVCVDDYAELIYQAKRWRSPTKRIDKNDRDRSLQLLCGRLVCLSEEVRTHWRPSSPRTRSRYGDRGDSGSIPLSVRQSCASKMGFHRTRNGVMLLISVCQPAGHGRRVGVTAVSDNKVKQKTAGGMWMKTAMVEYTTNRQRSTYLTNDGWALTITQYSL